MARRRPGLAAVLAAALLLPAAAAPAAVVPPPPPPVAGTAAIEASTLTYDRATGRVTAEGDVRIAYGLYRLRADTVVYDTATGAMQAQGDVRLREPDGSVLSGSRVALSGDFASGVIEGFGLAFGDGSRLAAARAERIQGRRTRMTDVAFTPCTECGGEEPLWSLEAGRVAHDSETRNIAYRDVALRVGGVPIAFTPYLVHPDPTVARRQGFLAPRFAVGGDIGLLVRNYYHYPWTASRDATVEGSISTRHGPLLGARYRQRLARGEIAAEASLTRAGPAPSGTDLERGALRGHASADGRFALNRHWRASATTTLTRDSAYLGSYAYAGGDLLETSVAAERFSATSYARLRGAAWQDLRPPGQRPRPEPVVLPEMRYAALTPEPLLGGRVSGESVVSALHRRAGQRDVRRAASRLAWQRQEVTARGVQVRAAAELAGAAYWYEDYAAAGGEGTALQLQPVAELGAAYPLIARHGWGRVQLRPETALIAAPEITEAAVPAEDSSIVELDTGNLFARDRAAGFDQLESGYRAVYGLRASGGGSRIRTEAFLGRSRALDGTAPFPGSGGLDQRLSDVVGSLRGEAGTMSLAYRFRADPETARLPRQEARAAVERGPWEASADYIGLAALGPYDRREELTLKTGTTVTADWDVTLAHTRRFDPPAGPQRNTVELGFNCDCLDFSASLAQTFSGPAREKVAYSAQFSLSLKHLGAVGE